MVAPGGDDSPAARKAVNGRWMAVILDAGFRGLSAAGSAPTDFDFDPEMARVQHEPARPALQR
jgi:hypothetical protein